MDLNLKVNVSLNANASTIYTPVEQASARAKKKLTSDADETAAGQKRAAADAAKAAAKEQADLARKAAASQKAIAKAAQDAAQEQKKAAADTAKASAKAQADMVRDVQKAANDRVRALKEANREIERDLKQSLRDRERDEAASNKRSRESDRNAHKNLHRAEGYARSITSVGSFGARLAGDVARGAGVDLSASGFVSKYVAKQDLATNVAIHGYNPASKQAANKTRVSGDELSAQAEEVGKYAAYDPQKALEGLDQFVKLTGDLETGRAALKPLAQLARATGSKFEDMINAAGPVSKNLGDVGDTFKTAEEKAEAVVKVLAGFSLEGKIGSVDISDLARTVPKIAAAAGQVYGKTQGEKISNMLAMGALAQESRGVGGAASPQQAAGAASAFVNTFMRPQNLKIWNEKYKIGTHKEGMLNTPEALILESLQATHGNQKQMGELWRNSNAYKAVLGFTQKYREAYYGTKGTEVQKNRAGKLAAHEEFKQYTGTLSKEDIETDFAKSMQDAAAKAQIFQNNLQEIADKAITKIIPAMEKLVPKFLALAEAVGKIAGWAAENPMAAVTAALVASIGKAAIGEAIKGALLKMMGGGGGAGAGGTGAGGMIGGAVAAAAVGIGVGKLLSDHMVDTDTRMRENPGIVNRGTDDYVSHVRAAAGRGEIGAERAEGEISTLKQLMARQVESAKEQQKERIFNASDPGLLLSGQRDERLKQDDTAMAQTMDSMMKIASAIESMKQIIESQKNSPQNVHVVNASEISLAARAGQHLLGFLGGNSPPNPQ